MAIWAVMAQTGRETEAADRIRRSGIACSVPMRTLPERRGGIWRPTVRVMVPGYIFADIPDAGSDAQTGCYYRIVSTPGVLRVLGALAAADAAWLRELDNGGRPWEISHARRTCTGYEIYSGPLVGREARIIDTDAHRQRARVAIVIGDRQITIGLGLKFCS